MFDVTEMVLTALEGALAGLVDGLLGMATFEVEESLKNAWGLFGTMNGDVDGPALSGVSKVFLHLVDPMGGGAIGCRWVSATGSENA